MQECRQAFYLLMRVCGLDQLSSGVQQNGIGVWPGPEDPITVVEVVVERLGDLVGAAVLIVLVWEVSLPEVAQVWVSGSHALILLGLHRN